MGVRLPIEYNNKIDLFRAKTPFLFRPFFNGCMIQPRNPTLLFHKKYIVIALSSLAGPALPIHTFPGSCFVMGWSQDRDSLLPGIAPSERLTHILATYRSFVR
jgi:hypothetical protein